MGFPEVDQLPWKWVMLIWCLKYSYTNPNTKIDLYRGCKGRSLILSRKGSGFNNVCLKYWAIEDRIKVMPKLIMLMWLPVLFQVQVILGLDFNLNLSVSGFFKYQLLKFGKYWVCCWFMLDLGFGSTHKGCEPNAINTLNSRKSSLVISPLKP